MKIQFSVYNSLDCKEPDFGRFSVLHLTETVHRQRHLGLTTTFWYHQMDRQEFAKSFQGQIS